MAWQNRIVGAGTEDPEKLVPHPKNWRKHPKGQAAALEGAIEEIGWIQDIIINQRTGRMIDGHLRAELAVKNKERTVPVKYVDLSEEEEEKALLTLDPISMMAEADKDRLADLLQTVTSDNEKVNQLLEDIGREYKVATKKAEEDDYDPPAEIETDIKRGDIIQLGRHRVMCGDARTDLIPFVGSASVGLLLTDPPYGISVVGGGGPTKFGKVGGGGPTKFGKVVGVGWVASKTYPVVEGDESTDTCKESLSKIKSDNKIIFGGNYFTDFLPPSRCWLIWDKENIGNFADAELAWTSFDKGVKIYRWMWNGLSRKGARDIEGVTRLHPTQKPVGLFAEILKDFSKGGDVILDPFLGSGTTLIACEQLDRICYGMEISPQYCEVICQRWEKFTGQTRLKIGDLDT